MHPVLAFFSLTKEEQSHEAAVRLYNEYGSNLNLKRRFAQIKRGEWRKEKVLYELKKLLPSLSIREDVGSAKEKEDSLVIPVPPIIDQKNSAFLATIGETKTANSPTSVALTDELAPKDNGTQPVAEGGIGFWLEKRKRLFTQKAILSNSLHGFAEDDNAGRAMIMKQISDIDTSISECNNAISALNDGAGIVVEKVTPAHVPKAEWKPAESLIELIKQLNALKTARSKLRASQANGKDTTTQQQEITEKITLIKALIDAQANTSTANGNEQS